MRSEFFWVFAIGVLSFLISGITRGAISFAFFLLLVFSALALVRTLEGGEKNGKERYV